MRVKAVEILLPFAAAQIDAEAGGIDAGLSDAGIAHGLLGRADGETGVPAAQFPDRGIFAHVG